MESVLPDKFETYLREAIGSADCAAVLESIVSGNPVISIRLNPLKSIPEYIDSVVNIAKRNGDKVPWCRDGYYLKERPDFTLDPTFHAGAYYVQDASSMFLSLLEPLIKSRSAILDLCAAPGGKSTHLISMKSPNGRITANEVIRSRYSILKENLTKWGDRSVEMLSLDPTYFNKKEINHKGIHGEPIMYDFVLVDAPCSGEGLFRKDRAAMREWSEDMVRMCAARQRRILSDIWSSLASGGYLVYSTCTFNKYENEENILWLREEYGAEIVPLEQIVDCRYGGVAELSLIEKWGIRKSDIVGYRFLPGVVRGEGQYFALVRKPGNSTGIEKSSTLRESRQRDKVSPGNHKRHANGVVAPEIEEALSVNYDGTFPSVELSKEYALRFLSRETILLKDAPLGYLRVTYGDLGLGFVKNIGSRANNLYPVGWKIRKRIR